MSEKPQDPEQAAETVNDQPAEQQPTLQSLFDAFFNELDLGFNQELGKTSERLKEARTSLEKEIEKARADMARCRDKQRETCNKLTSTELNAEEQAQQIVTTIESQMALIFRRVRPAVDRSLRPFSPRREPVIGLLRQIHESYLKAAQKLSEQPPAASAPSVDDVTTDKAAQPRNKLLELSRAARQSAEKSLSLTPRKVAEEFLSSRPAPGQNRLVPAYRKAYEETQTRLSDTWRGLRFHLEIALDDLLSAQDADLAESNKGSDLTASLRQTCLLATEVYTDADAKLAASLQPLTAFLDKLGERLRQEHKEVVNELRDTLEEVDTWGTITGHTLRWSLGRARKVFREGRERLSQGGEEMSRTAGNGISQTGGTLLKNLQSLLGKSDTASELLLNLADLPTVDAVFERAEELPGLYRRLFTLGPLKNREFMVARDEELESLEEVLKRWEEGKASSVALVGPEGSGKTSLINCFESEFGNRGTVLRTEFHKRLRNEADLLSHFCERLECREETTDLDKLAEHLLNGPRRLIIVEGGHLLALRAVDGRQAARGFLQLMLATHRHCLWLVSFRKYPWQRLDYQIGIGRYFTHQVRTLFHDKEELREAILLRHRTAGMPLTFLGNDADTSEEAGKANEERFFSSLFDISSGNLDAAIYCWLISTRYRPEGDTLAIAPLGRPDLGFLRNLGRDYHFALAEIVGNGGLTVEEYCRIFRCGRDCGRMTLDYLVHLNLVKMEANEGSRHYCLNPVFFGPVTKFLETLNILY